MLTTNDWHDRFLQQARWTKDLRNYLFELAGLSGADLILEIGCGTGAILTDLANIPDYQLHGLDLAFDRLQFAQHNCKHLNLTLGNALSLPFKSSCLDITICHFLLLWIEYPLSALLQMVRVTRPGGKVIALAEPDYGGRIDYPIELTKLGELQRSALKDQGANPQVGRQLRSLFSKAGLTNIEAGVVGGQWLKTPTDNEIALEHQILRDDLKLLLSPKEIDDYLKIDRAAWENGERVLFVPTFYAYGEKP